VQELPVTTPDLRPVVEACPGCGRIDGVEQTSASPRVEACQCQCGMSWAISLVNPHLRDRADDYAEQVRVARWILGQVVQLADDMPKFTDVELRHGCWRWPMVPGEQPGPGGGREGDHPVQAVEVAEALTVAAENR
jgi:hypothetical protein